MNCEIATCGKEINYDGALLLSPPNDLWLVKKIHICKDCYLYIYNEYIKSIKNMPPIQHAKPDFTKFDPMNING